VGEKLSSSFSTGKQYGAVAGAVVSVVVGAVVTSGCEVVGGVVGAIAGAVTAPVRACISDSVTPMPVASDSDSTPKEQALRVAEAIVKRARKGNKGSQALHYAKMVAEVLVAASDGGDNTGTNGFTSRLKRIPTEQLGTQFESVLRSGEPQNIVADLSTAMLELTHPDREPRIVRVQARHRDEEKTL
jgi:hypothetical protein